ncbi:hypothetical protein ALC57_02510 [Trachymyrmex cornetzi]|uniref:Uncharacterized protein n=1 Tax=Trachymyrmex cornetzi TaxID=471704 RepID=A0A195EJL6_9HYME|nr:hypothetical protein ALC57_02510 [Trachymyrmex cornetzi]
MGAPSKQVSIEYRYRFSLLVAIELRRGTLARVANLRKEGVASIVKETDVAVIRMRRGRNRKAKAKMDFSGCIVRGTMKGKSPSV